MLIPVPEAAPGASGQERGPGACLVWGNSVPNVTTP